MIAGESKESHNSPSRSPEIYSRRPPKMTIARTVCSERPIVVATGVLFVKEAEVRHNNNEDFSVTSTERRTLTYFDPI